MTQLEFGIMDSFESQQGQLAADAYDWHIEYAKAAEQHGYSYYFFIEHQNAFFPVITSPNVYLGALARETTKLRFGPMVYQVPLYHPIRLAQDCAMVDQLSRGRLEFGLGYGPQKHEFDRWNLPFTERRAMGVEAMEIVLKAWTEETITYSGEYWTFKEARPKPKPFQQPHPPVWMGAHSHKSFEYAAEMNFDVAQNIDIDTIAGDNFHYFRQMWEKGSHSGPIPRRMLVRHIHVAETDDQARKEAEPFLVQGMRAQQRILQPEEATPTMVEHVRVYEATKDSYDYWVDNGLAIIGSPETVAKRLEAGSQEMDYNVFCCQHHLMGMPIDLVLSSMRLLGDRVIPELR